MFFLQNLMGEEDSSAPFEVQEVEEEEDAGNEEQDHNEVTVSLVVSTSRQIEIEIENVLSVETNF